MTLKTFFFFFAALISLSVSAQDKIYKTDGSIITAKVKAIKENTVNYKRSDNPDGPDYTILKKEVIKIVYENGIVDNFEAANNSVRGRKYSKSGSKKDKHSYKYGDNILTAIPGAYTVSLIDGSMNDPGVGICYERVLDDRGHISVSLPIMVNFLQEKDFNSNFYNNSGNYFGGSGNYYAYLFMPGVKFYPADAAQRTRYSIGASLFALFGNEPYSVYDGNSGITGGDWHYNMYGLMISNSLNMSVSKHFYMEIDINGGIPFSDNRHLDNSSIDGIVTPMVQFVLKVGTRF